MFYPNVHAIPAAAREGARVPETAVIESCEGSHGALNLRLL